MNAETLVGHLRSHPQYGQDICEPRLANFRGVRLATWRLSSAQEYVIIIYSSYDAMGLIGSECNGIAILNHTTKQVILDEHLKQGSGYECPTSAQVLEVQRLWELSDADFTSFCRSHPRYRL